MNPDKISTLVGRELQKIVDPKLVKKIRELLVSPYSAERVWDYGAPGQQFTCWIFLEHRPSNSGIAFCSEGFGPSNPWGLIFLSGPHMSIGMDCAWYASLEDAMRGSIAWDGSNPEGYETR